MLKEFAVCFFLHSVVFEEGSFMIYLIVLKSKFKLVAILVEVLHNSIQGDPNTVLE